MRHNRRTWKRSTALLMTLAMVLSLPTGITTPRQAQAADYGLNNPTTDSNGVTTWDCVYFGNYWQNDTNGDGVADENDEKQPIKWRVLSVDGDDAFLLADQNLDAKEYDEDSKWSRTWETCTLRSWLNGYKANFNQSEIDYSSDNFIDAAFTSEEQSAIKQTTVVNENNPYYDTEGSNDTNDQIYLLSIAEASNASYGFNSTFDTGSETRQSLNTDFAKGHHAYTYEGTGIWWLRSPGEQPGNTSANYSAAMVSSGGFGSYDDFSGDLYDGYWHVEDILVTVRPVLHLDLSSDFWSYADTVSAKEDAASDVTPAPSDSKENPSDVTTWDCIYFGHYWQNDTNGDGKADKNDEKQPIKWRILSMNGNEAFLIADQNLDAKSYNETSTSVTWETCTLRSWLNGYSASSNVESIDYSSDNFIDAAFTTKEQNAIKISTVVNEDNPEYGTEGGNDTNDRIYLLSISEACNASFGFNSVFTADSDTRVAKNTTYVSDIAGDWILNCWWLRSPGLRSEGAACIGQFGGGGNDGFPAGDDSRVVRPVLRLDLSSNLWMDAGVVSSDGKSYPSKKQNTSSIKATKSPSTPHSSKTVAPAAVGTTIKDKTASYKVVSADKKQPAVAYTKVLKKNASSVTVPDKIKVNGVTYQVKSIAPKAFANNKKLKKITISKNVTSIGKQAFAGCKKLKKITIKSAKLKSSSIGKNAFKGTAKKLTVKVPKKQYKAYKNFLKKKGNKTIRVMK